MIASGAALTWRRAVVTVVAGSAILCAVWFLASARAHEKPAPDGAAPSEQISPDQSLKLLQDGNGRFVSGIAEHPHQNVERRRSVAKGQHPFAIVLACADSRVAPELV